MYLECKFFFYISFIKMSLLDDNYDFQMTFTLLISEWQKPRPFRNKILKEFWL